MEYIWETCPYNLDVFEVDKPSRHTADRRECHWETVLNDIGATLILNLLLNPLLAMDHTAIVTIIYMYHDFNLLQNDLRL